MSRQLLWALGILIGAGLLAFLMVFLKPEPAQEDRDEQAPLVKTVALKAASGEIPVLASGTVQPREEVSVGVQVAGRLTYVNPNFREGGELGAGATILRIDQSDYLNTVRGARADVAAQQVAVLQAEQEVAIAREELNRFANRQSRSNAVSGQTQILLPKDMARQAGTSTAQTPDKKSSSSNILATREPQLRSAKAARDRASANLADARLALSRTNVTAPFRGLVRQESAAVGSLVQPGQALGTIVSTAAYEVRLSLTPAEAALIPGLLKPNRGRIPASVFYEFGGLTYRWPAFVDRANPILDATTRNIEVFLRVPAPLAGGQLVGDASAGGEKNAPPLLLDAFVTAEITGASLDSYAAIPSSALRPGNEIWVVRDDKLQILPVRVIQRSDDTAYIATATLDKGGELVTSSLATPTSGMPVRTAPPKKTQ